LYADEEGLDIEGPSIGIFTWTNTSTTPNSEPEYWDKTADWELIKVANGYLIRSLKYSVYVYAAAVSDDLADGDHIVLTKENMETLGEDAIWNFESDLAGNFQNVEELEITKKNSHDSSF
jgi:hypothetical protein